MCSYQWWNLQSFFAEDWYSTQLSHPDRAKDQFFKYESLTCGNIPHLAEDLSADHVSRSLKETGGGRAWVHSWDSQWSLPYKPLLSHSRIAWVWSGVQWTEQLSRWLRGGEGRKVPGNNLRSVEFLLLLCGCCFTKTVTEILTACSLSTKCAPFSAEQ